MNKKTTAVLLVVLILVIIGAVWYFEANSQGAAPVATGSPARATSTATSTASSSAVSYVNSQYGFSFALPTSWQGYTIVTSTWTGYSTPVVHGPIISIRNPLWTSSTPTQDIPIMVFTPSEWSAVSSGTLAVGAAPIPPSELGQNAQYVFALPARYNYAYPADWQEVQTILQGNPLQAF